MRWKSIQKLLFFLSFFTVSLSAEPPYILCIDGGGSKTLLQVLDGRGQVVSLVKDNMQTNTIASSGSNINTVGEVGVRAVLHGLFEDVKIEEDSSFLVDHLPHCQVIAGMAGVSLEKSKLKMVALLEEWGLRRDQIIVMSDAELALKLVEKEGIILISGTGSVCFGKKNGTLFRVGGLGPILGDEGSGYQIGVQAFKAALAEEYGWGEKTHLLPAMKEMFNVAELKSLIPQINLREMPPANIASSAPLVFKLAMDGDAVAKQIIDRAAADLGTLIATQIRISKLYDCQIHLWGGIFKSPNSDAFIQTMMEQVPGNGEGFKIINYSNQNAAVLFASKFLNVK